MSASRAPSEAPLGQMAACPVGARPPDWAKVIEPAIPSATASARQKATNGLALNVSPPSIGRADRRESYPILATNFAGACYCLNEKVCTLASPVARTSRWYWSSTEYQAAIQTIPVSVVKA